MKLLITGSNGFFGSNFIKKYNKKFKKIIGISKSKCKIKFKNYKHYELDINNYKRLKNIFIKEKPDIVILTASNSIVSTSEKKPEITLQTNVFAQVRIFDIIRSLDMKIVIFSIESILLYGDQRNIKIKLKETIQPKPTNTYQYSKYLLSKFSELYRNQFNLKIYSLRPASLYGPNDLKFSRMMPKNIINMLSNKNPIVYSGFSSLSREFLYIYDFCDVVFNIIKFKKKIPPDIYNIGSGNVYTLKEVLDKIINKINPKLKIQKIKVEGEITKINNLVLDSSKIKKYIKISNTDFDESINETIKFYKKLNTK
tara:strand:+ start:403 stop:1338 length:936 start_codon:yes stop_codon:yes gene_type:complete